MKNFCKGSIELRRGDAFYHAGIDAQTESGQVHCNVIVAYGSDKSEMSAEERRDFVLDALTKYDLLHAEHEAFKAKFNEGCREHADRWHELDLLKRDYETLATAHQNLVNGQANKLHQICAQRDTAYAKRHVAEMRLADAKAALARSRRREEEMEKEIDELKSSQGTDSTAVKDLEARVDTWKLSATQWRSEWERLNQTFNKAEKEYKEHLALKDQQIRNQAEAMGVLRKEMDDRDGQSPRIAELIRERDSFQRDARLANAANEALRKRMAQIADLV